MQNINKEEITDEDGIINVEKLVRVINSVITELNRVNDEAEHSKFVTGV